MTRKLDRFKADCIIKSAVDIGKFFDLHAILHVLRWQYKQSFHLICAVDERIDRMLGGLRLQICLQLADNLCQGLAGGGFQTYLLRQDIRSSQKLHGCHFADTGGSTDKGLGEVGCRQLVGGLYDFRRLSCQKVKSFLRRGRNIGFAGKNCTITALCCAYMLQRVDDNIVLRENDIAVFTGKLKNQLFGNYFTGSA